MIISVNWLKKFTDIDIPVEQLASLIGERLVEIESVNNIGEKYKDVIVAKVVECAPLEGSDHLNVTKIDDGGRAEGIERDENGLVQVVCGAPNVKAGMFVAWLAPNTVVPETFGTSEPFVLGAKALRGVVSNGMLASARELDLYDDHDGILEIDKDTTPGASFAELYELNDYLLDIENKSLTHRPDAFGVIGFAREVAGIQGKAFVTPEWLSQLDPEIANDGTAYVPAISIEDASLSDRFQAIVLSGIDEKAQSPIQLQTYLARSGIRPISASVDVSNYLMLLTGQPSHAYDYDKLRSVAGDDFTVRVRLAHPEEKLTLLDGKEITLHESDIVIAAGSIAVGLAGIMGGRETLVDETTKSVLFEVATFDLYRMRSSQMRHGIFSEAVTRFTKGIPAPLSAPVLAEAVKMLEVNTGGHATSAPVEDYAVKRDSISIVVTEAHVNNTLGTHFSAEDISELLHNVGFGVTFDGLTATVNVPYWRQDIHIAEDIIEEVGRLAGFDTINPILPRRDFAAVRPSSFDELRSRVRRSLARAGANEVLTYSFVHSDMFKKAGQDESNAYRIVNSISPALQYYRQSLTPSLLDNVFQNVKNGFDSFALFESNKVHQKADGLTDEQVPVEADSLALVVVDAKRKDAAYYQAKHLLEYVAATLGVTFEYKHNTESTVTGRPFEPKRSALIVDSASGSTIGVIGEYTKAVQKGFKLPAFAAGFEINPYELLKSVQALGVQYAPTSRYPGTERDVCFQVGHEITYAQIITAAKEALAQTGLVTGIEPLDIYAGDNSPTKNITVRIALASYQKTLTSEEVAGIMNTIIDKVLDTTGGKVI